MYSIEKDYLYLVGIKAETLEEAKKIADREHCALYKDNKLIYTPSRKEKE